MVANEKGNGQKRRAGGGAMRIEEVPEDERSKGAGESGEGGRECSE